jgi:hypothetical protein
MPIAFWARQKRMAALGITKDISKFYSDEVELLCCVESIWSEVREIKAGRGK